MFRIRTEQYEALGKKTRTKFESKLTSYFAEHWSECFPGADAQAIGAWVHTCVGRALASKIDTEPETAQLLLLFIMLGADANADWVNEVLRDKALIGVGKVRRLIELSRERGVEDVDHYVVVEKFRLPLPPPAGEIFPYDDESDAMQEA